MKSVVNSFNFCSSERHITMETLHQSTKDQLKSIIERVERLEEEKAALSTDIKEVFAEAKSNGFDVKALRAIIRMRKKGDDERTEEEMILATYMQALDMLPLFAAASEERRAA
jgi:uncharacterized protein (UPF0335 family)